jgi:hypothetical protein
MKIRDPLDPKSLIESLAVLPDDDLITMINVHPGQYHEDALTIARAEMVRRGYHLSKGVVVTSKKNVAKPDKAASPVVQNPHSPVCPRCLLDLEYVGTRRLNDEKEMSVLGVLGEMYKSGAHEFLDVYTCRRCGHVELFVDGVGEEFRPY